MIRVPNAASYAALHFLSEVLGRKCGGSTGTNLFGVYELASGMVARGEQGAIVTLICDSGRRYLDSYFNPDWLEARIDITRGCCVTAAFSKRGAGNRRHKKRHIPPPCRREIRTGKTREAASGFSGRILAKSGLHRRGFCLQ